jgi:hypothetical protein
MDISDKALRINSLLYKSQLKIESIIAQSNFGIYYLATSYLNGKALIIKELFNKDCIRRIDGSVDVFGVNPNEFKQLKQSFAQTAETMKQSQQIEDFFEENGTIYYVAQWQEGKEIRDYPKIPSYESDYQVISEININELAGNSKTDFGYSSYLGESLITKVESIISPDESLISADNEIDNSNKKSEVYDNQILSYNIEKDSIIQNQDETSIITNNEWEKLAEQEVQNLAKKIAEDLKEAEEKVKSPFQKWSESSEEKVQKPDNQRITYQKAEYTTQDALQDFAKTQQKPKEFVTLPSIDKTEKKPKNKTKNKNQGSYQEFEQKLKNQANVVKPPKKKTSWAWFIWLGVSGFLFFWFWSTDNSPEFKTEDSKSISTPPKFDKFEYTKIGPYSEDLRWAIRGGKIGFIDSTGAEVIAAKYDASRDFREGMAWVQINAKIGFIDKTGKEVIPIQYDGARDFSEGVAWVKIGDLIGYVNQTGKEITRIKYTGAYDFKNGMGKVMLKNKYGFVNQAGLEVIPPTYENIGEFANDRVFAFKNGKMGYLDKSGKVVIPFIYETGVGFSENRAWVVQNGKRGFIDTEGKAITDFKYEGTRDFSNGMAWVRNNGLVGYINLEGKEVIPLKYAGAWDFTEDLAGVIINGKVGFIDKNDNLVIPAQFETLDSTFTNGVAKVKQNGVSFFINRQGQRVSEDIKNIKPSQSGKYDTQSPYNAGVAIVSKNGKYGLIDEDEVEITELTYDFIDIFSQDVAAFRQGATWGYLNNEGEAVIKAQFAMANPFSEGLACVKVGDKFGYINLQGKLIIPSIYSQAGNFREGLAGVQLNNRRFGYITPQGGIAIPFTFQEAGDFLNGKAMVKANGKAYFIDKSGKCVRNCD